jgi:CheY-like chemotaxis protein
VRILIVEDNAILAFEMDGILTSAGYQVIGLAWNETTALEMAPKLKPELALVDLHLAQGTSGAVVARSLREQYGIPAFFVSASPDECRRAAKDAQVIGCLTKPFTPQGLLAAVAVAQAIISDRELGDLPRDLEIYH